MAEMIHKGEILYFCEESMDALLVKLCVACKDTDLCYWLEQYAQTLPQGSGPPRYDPEGFVTFLIGNMVVKPMPYREIGVGDWRQFPSWMDGGGAVTQRQGAAK